MTQFLLMENKTDVIWDYEWDHLDQAGLIPEDVQYHTQTAKEDDINKTFEEIDNSISK